MAESCSGCKDMDWRGEDYSLSHHPDCPTLKPSNIIAAKDLGAASDDLQGFACAIGMSSPEIWADRIMEHYRKPFIEIESMGPVIEPDSASHYLLITESRTGLRFVADGHYTPVLPRDATAEEIQRALDELPTLKDLIAPSERASGAFISSITFTCPNCETINQNVPVINECFSCSGCGQIGRIESKE